MRVHEHGLVDFDKVVNFPSLGWRRLKFLVFCQRHGSAVYRIGFSSRSGSTYGLCQLQILTYIIFGCFSISTQALFFFSIAFSALI